MHLGRPRCWPPWQEGRRFATENLTIHKSSGSYSSLRVAVSRAGFRHIRQTRFVAARARHVTTKSHRHGRQDTGAGDTVSDRTIAGDVDLVAGPGRMTEATPTRFRDVDAVSASRWAIQPARATRRHSRRWSTWTVTRGRARRRPDRRAFQHGGARSFGRGDDAPGTAAR